MRPWEEMDQDEYKRLREAEKFTTWASEQIGKIQLPALPSLSLPEPPLERLGKTSRPTDTMQDPLAKLPRLSPLQEINRSLGAGYGSIASGVGSAVEWLGNKDLGRRYKAFGEKLQSEAPPEIEMAGPEVLGDPRLYTRNIPRAVPFMLTSSLIGAPLGGIAGGLAAKILPSLSRPVLGLIQASGAAVGSRLFESALEAGGTYDEALGRGRSEEDASQAAWTTFAGNLPASIPDAAQWALAFRKWPVPAKRELGQVIGKELGARGRGAIKVLARIAGTAAMEGLEEGYQTAVGQYALGDKVNPFTPEGRQAMAMGAVMGGMFGAAGQLGQAVQAGAVKPLEVAKKLAPGMTVQPVGPGGEPLSAREAIEPSAGKVEEVEAPEIPAQAPQPGPTVQGVAAPEAPSTDVPLWMMTLADFERERPSVPGYLFHGSPQGDITQIDPNYSTQIWREGQGFYTTDNRDKAVGYARGSSARGERKAGAATQGRINYVEGTPANALDFDAPADQVLWTDIASVLGLDPPTGLYLKEGQSFTNGAAYRELAYDYSQENQTSGDEAAWELTGILSARDYDATTHREGLRKGPPHKVTVWIEKPEGQGRVSARVVPPKEVHRRVVEQAIREGKPVSAEVLADYPDLAPVRSTIPPAAQRSGRVEPGRPDLESSRRVRRLYQREPDVPRTPAVPPAPAPARPPGAEVPAPPVPFTDGDWEEVPRGSSRLSPEQKEAIEEWENSPNRQDLPDSAYTIKMNPDGYALIEYRDEYSQSFLLIMNREGEWASEWKDPLRGETSMVERWFAPIEGQEPEQVKEELPEREDSDRAFLRYQLVHDMNLPEDQADAVVAITDARAGAWAKATGRQAHEWYQTRLAGIEIGGKPAKGALYQADLTEPDTREIYAVGRTSVKQVPEVFRKTQWTSGTTNLDIGGGKYDDGTQYLRTQGVTNLVLDPYNRGREHNQTVLDQIRERPVDSVTVANVLNVISSPEIRDEVIREAGKHARSGATLRFSVYEGNVSSKGHKTSAGTWQENRKLASYLPEIQAHYPDARIERGHIVATKGGQASVGKVIGNDRWVHRSAEDSLPTEVLARVKKNLPPDWDYAIVKYNKLSQTVSFIKSPDWDTATEPIVGDSFIIKADGTTSIVKGSTTNPQIYHQKELFVRPDYQGFDVDVARARTRSWQQLPNVPRNLIGRKSYWETNVVPKIGEPPLAQRGKGGFKGYIEFLEDGRAVIHAFESADVSTAVHELAHVFRRDLEGPDLAVLESWAGVRDNVWGTVHEERFADAFVQYLSDGKAPTPGLKAVFERFKDWLGKIYGSIAPQLEYTPEVRAVFDRLLGGEGIVEPAAQVTQPESSEVSGIAVDAWVQTPGGQKAQVRNIGRDVQGPYVLARYPDGTQQVLRPENLTVTTPPEPKAAPVPKAKPSAEPAPPAGPTTPATTPAPAAAPGPAPGKARQQVLALPTERQHAALTPKLQMIITRARDMASRPPSTLAQAVAPSQLDLLHAASQPDVLPLGQRALNAYRQFVRGGYDRIYQAQDLQRRTGIEVSFIARNVPGAQMAAEADIRRYVMPVVDPLGADVTHLQDYMVGKRMADLLALEPNAVLANDVTHPARALSELETKLGPQRFQAVERAARQLWQLNDDLVLRPLVDEGIISREAYQAIKTKWPHYVPFRRQDFAFEWTAHATGLKRPADYTQNIIHSIQMEGSTRKLEEPLVSWYAQVVKSRVAIERNRAARALVASLAQLQINTGQSILDFRAIEETTSRGVIHWMDDGRQNEVQAPRMWKEMAAGLETEIIGFWNRLALAASAPLRTGAVVWNAAFIAKNLARDLGQAWFQEGMNPGRKTYWRGVMAAFTKNADWWETAHAGALMSGYTETARRVGDFDVGRMAMGIKVKNIGDALLFVWHAIAQVNENIEQSTRIATYLQAHYGKKPIAAIEAAFKARNVTVDFGRSGYVVRVINQAIPFLNAGLQGVANTVAMIGTRPGEALLRASPFMAISGLVALSNALWESSDDIPDYEYQYAWPIQIGEYDAEPDPRYPDEPKRKRPVYINIPKPPAAAFLTAPVEIALTYGRRNKDRTLQEQVLRAAANMTMAMTPFEPNASAVMIPGLGTGVQLQANYDFFRGRQIVPEREMSRPPEERFGPETTAGAVAIGRALKASPRGVDFAIADVTAGTGQQVAWLVDMALRGIGYNPQAPGQATRAEQTETEKLARVPIVSSFLKTRGTQPEREAKEKLDVALEESRRTLYENPEARRFGLGVNPVSAAATINGQAVEIPPDRRLWLQRQNAELVKAGLDAVTATEYYEGLEDAEKRKVLDLMRGKVTDNVRDQVVAEIGGQKAGRLWTAEEMPSLASAVIAYQQYRAIPLYRGVSSAQVAKFTEAARVITAMSKQLPPGSKNVGQMAQARAIASRPDLGLYIRYLPYLKARRNPARQQFWQRNARLLERYFGTAASAA